ncbi:hypothetical protein LMIY3S_03693 [Labrys miyagiensis]
MSIMMYVRPADPKAKLVHPVSGRLPATGGDWLADQFTFRLLQDRAILIEVKPPVSAALSPPAADPGPDAPPPPAPVETKADAKKDGK